MLLGPYSFSLSTLFKAAKEGDWPVVLNYLHMGWVSIKAKYQGISLMDIAEKQRNGNVIKMLQKFNKFLQAAADEDNISPSSPPTFTTTFNHKIHVPTPFRPYGNEQKYCEFISNSFPNLRASFDRSSSASP